MMVVGGFWLLARGVVGWDSERGVPSSSTTASATPFDPTLGGIDAPGGCVGESGFGTDAGEAGRHGGLAPTLPLRLTMTSMSAPRR